MIEKVQFGEVKVGDFDKPIYKYSMKNTNMIVEVIDYGATIVSIKVPDRNGQLADVVLGFDCMKGYYGDNNPYFGATIGRVCNRIANGKIRIKDKVYNISANVPPNTLHGGFRGLDKIIWDTKITEPCVLQMSCVSDRLEEGFPGYVQFKILFELTEDDEFKIKLTAKSTELTPINLTNHSYFNLSGEETGAKGVYEHQVQILASKYTPTDRNLIPTGEILTVKNTFLDLTTERVVGEAIKGTPDQFGFDNNYCVDGTGFRLAAKAHHPPSGRTLLVYSNQPGVQFYTGNWIDNVQGKGKNIYGKHSGFCFETQNYPNAVNTPSFPSSLLDPSNEYCHIIVYKFLLE